MREKALADARLAIQNQEFGDGADGGALAYESGSSRRINRPLSEHFGADNGAEGFGRLSLEPILPAK